VTLIERVTRRPRRAWITTGLLLTVVSLSAPLSGHGITATERLALVCMHLAVAAVLIPVFALTIRLSQRPVEDAAGNSAAALSVLGPQAARVLNPLMSRPSELIATGPVISADLIPSGVS